MRIGVATEGVSANTALTEVFEPIGNRMGSATEVFEPAGIRMGSNDRLFTKNEKQEK